MAFKIQESWRKNAATIKSKRRGKKGRMMMINGDRPFRGWIMVDESIAMGFDDKRFALRMNRTKNFIFFKRWYESKSDRRMVNECVFWPNELVARLRWLSDFTFSGHYHRLPLSYVPSKISQTSNFLWIFWLQLWLMNWMSLDEEFYFFLVRPIVISTEWWKD